ncbi:SDR family NAD(P)-dependent oxidoreductase [Chondromyces apiculatus]|uniref:Short-chain dehydrogenase/reductase SDR n=1 Tax=Chondromyces apiculatus DSM 436 TaxID=1192034 RepID=A0A017T596_9BACT|nr:SDR family NAD(P)-dependent oxidoreductase [Chondromyces apiculatus]EYF04443.1 Short-chain dehydrogenase/reductase SDR [Chondromyces apiculatus DSM 436]
MVDRLRLEGRTAVVTGAASGIGRAIAISLARRGCHLALADVNEAGLAETARLVETARPGRAPALRVSEHRLDVSDREAVAGFPARIAGEHPRVDLLVNNAGVAVGGTFEQVSEEDFEWLFSINFWGVVRMTRAFLPVLRASDDARIVNLSSVFGLIAPAGQAAYVASKFAVRGFSESLRHELEGSRVGVTVVHPGGVATAISESARAPSGAPAEEVARQRAAFKKHLRLPPEVAGETIVRGVERRKARVLVGNDAVALSVIERVAPVSYWKLLGRVIRE